MRFTSVDLPTFGRPTTARTGTGPAATGSAEWSWLALDTASRTSATTCSTTSSSVYGVVSMCSASSAIVNGEAARPESSVSRRSRSCSVAVRSAPFCSAARRVARAEGSAVRYTFTSASGATTVPMSRPSTTMSPSPMTSRCSRSSRSRIAGTALTALTADGHRLAADRLRHVGPADGDRGVLGVGAGDQHRLVGVGRDGLGVVGVDAVLEHPPGHRAVHRAGVEVAQPEPRGDAAGRARLAGPRGAVHRHDHAPAAHHCRPASHAL